jgi:cysteinyl-tRNA synthetase
MLDRLYGAVRGVEISDAERSKSEPSAAVIAALEDDLNTPKALAEMFNLARVLNKATDEDERRELAAELLASGDLVGLMQKDVEEWFSAGSDAALSAEEIEKLLQQREAARADRDFAAADAIRDKLAAAGISIEDGAAGTRWRRSG